MRYHLTLHGIHQLFSRLDWRSDLRDLCDRHVVTYLLLSFGLLCAGSVAFTYTPAPFHFFVRLYLVWMAMSLGLGFLLMARWWLVWLVGTLLWSWGMLALCIWQLIAYMEG